MLEMTPCFEIDNEYSVSTLKKMYLDEDNYSVKIKKYYLTSTISQSQLRMQKCPEKTLALGLISQLAVILLATGYQVLYWIQYLITK